LGCEVADWKGRGGWLAGGVCVGWDGKGGLLTVVG
jgi:hypothetical protein